MADVNDMYGTVLTEAQWARRDLAKYALESPVPGSIVSEGGVYRYLYWAPRPSILARTMPTLVVCMLNPSKAGTIHATDATVRWLMGYCGVNGYGRLVIGNVAALVSTDSGMLQRHADPIGPRNLDVLDQLCRMQPAVLCAWGNGIAGVPRAQDSIDLVRKTAASAMTLGLTRAGNPRHPLRLSHRVPAVRWLAEREVRRRPR